MLTVRGGSETASAEALCPLRPASTPPARGPKTKRRKDRMQKYETGLHHGRGAGTDHGGGGYWVQRLNSVTGRQPDRTMQGQKRVCSETETFSFHESCSIPGHFWWFRPKLWACEWRRLQGLRT